jgi:hypothetical protein
MFLHPPQNGTNTLEVPTSYITLSKTCMNKHKTQEYKFRCEEFVGGLRNVAGQCNLTLTPLRIKLRSSDEADRYI